MLFAVLLPAGMGFGYAFPPMPRKKHFHLVSFCFFSSYLTYNGIKNNFIKKYAPSRFKKPTSPLKIPQGYAGGKADFCETKAPIICRSRRNYFLI